MRRTITLTNTADRVRTCDLLNVDGRWLLVEDITDAQASGDRPFAYPSRVAFHVTDPAGPMAQDVQVVYRYMGEVVEFKPASIAEMGCTGFRPGGVAMDDPISHAARVSHAA